MANLIRHDENVLSQHFAALGRKGAKARKKALSPERRVEIARKASAAASAKRSKRTAE